MEDSAKFTVKFTPFCKSDLSLSSCKLISTCPASEPSTHPHLSFWLLHSHRENSQSSQLTCSVNLTTMVRTYPITIVFTHLNFLLLCPLQCCALTSSKGSAPTCQIQPPNRAACHQTRVLARHSYRTQQDSCSIHSTSVLLWPSN